MSIGLYSHTTRATGTVLTAAIYNSDHQNHITNSNPTMTGGYSDTLTQHQLTTDPGLLGTEILAGNMAVELEQLRFVISRIIGKAQWYEAPDLDIVAIDALFVGGAHTHAIADIVNLQTTLNALQASIDIKEPLGETVGVNSQTGTFYTLVLTDKGKIIEMSNVAANTLTIPANASVQFPINSRIDLVQMGSGQTAVVAAGGVTIRSEDSKLKINKRYGAVTMYKRGSDEWVLVGNLAL